jgi:dihydrodipicolinate synthase/N-acetylneuraminate lyase
MDFWSYAWKMKPEISPDILAIPPALLAEIEAAAEQERRPALDVLQDAVHRYINAKHVRLVPAYVQERARALGLGEGGEPRRLVRKVTEMSADELEAIGNTEMDARHDHLNAELE